MGNDFDDQASRLKKKRLKLSKAIAYKVEMAMVGTKMNLKSIKDDKENLEIETETKKEELKLEPDSLLGPSGQEVQEDRQPDPIESSAS